MKPLDLYNLKQNLAKLLPSSDVAKAFGKTEMCIYNWRTRRGLPHLSVPSRRSGRKGVRKPVILYEPSSVLRWARQQKIPIDEKKLGA